MHCVMGLFILSVLLKEPDRQLTGRLLLVVFGHVPSSLIIVSHSGLS